jgi:hypothetical protein
MIQLTNTLYEANAVLTTNGTEILFPLSLLIKRHSTQAAFKDAKNIIEKLQTEIENNPIRIGDLQVPALENDTCGRQTLISVIQESKNSVRLRIRFFAVLSLGQIGHFWQRTEVISQYLDFIKTIPEINLGKDISLSLQTAIFSSENNSNELNNEVNSI